MGTEIEGIRQFQAALAQRNIALLVGNGVNLFDQPEKALSWLELVTDLSKSRKVKLTNSVIDKLSFAEIGDILRSADEEPTKLPRDVVSAIKKFGQNKTSIGIFAQHHNLPVLTTNFDFRLAIGQDGKPQPLRHSISRKRNRKSNIPNGWNVYRGPKAEDLFARNIPGLWHLHGSIDLVSSIKLTSAQYATAFAKAFQLIKQGLYAKANCDIGSCPGCALCSWAGQSTWLDIFFHRNLIIVGFSFSKSETFLRPLLIERFKYLRHRYGHRNKIPNSYFVISKEDDFDEGQVFFFENLGFKIIRLDKRRQAFKDETFIGFGDIQS